MTNTPKPANPARLLDDLQHSAELKHQPVPAMELDPRLALLRGWQANRLACTYADLLNDPHDAPACQFFLNNVYAPTDFSQRDHDLARIHKFLSRVLPAQTIQLLTATVELNSMTSTLDDRLLHVLVVQLGMVDALTPELYAAAYRLCDNYAQRVRQIQLLRSILLEVGEGARFLVVGAAMKLAKTPAQRAGWTDLYDFVDQGRRAFARMRDAKTFVDTIMQRETNLLDLMYAGDMQGFQELAGLQ